MVLTPPLHLALQNTLRASISVHPCCRPAHLLLGFHETSLLGGFLPCAKRFGYLRTRT